MVDQSLWSNEERAFCVVQAGRFNDRTYKSCEVLMAVDEGKEIKNKKIDEILEGEENIPEKLNVIQNSSSDSDGDSKTLIYLSIYKKYHIEVFGQSQLNPIHHLNSLPLL